MSGSSGVVIVGAGHAGGVAAATLRQWGYQAPITLIGEEPVPPYQRPPLSKAWLKGEADTDALTLRPESFYSGAQIELRLSTRVEAIERQAAHIRLEGGEAVPYDTLILATGARARRLEIPGADFEGVMSLRSIADAELLKAGLRPGVRAAVIGGGYIGLEAAASARALGAEVTVIEREAGILARVAKEPLCGFLTRYHEGRGVAFEVAAKVAGFDGHGGKVAAVRLEEGRTIACDLVLLGVGLARNDELARAAGLPCISGVVVDEHARTPDPAIFAIGDVTHRPMPLYDRMFALESVANALEQAKQAAAAIVGRPPPPQEVTWNWSDQYDLKLQFAGLPFDAERIIVRGDPGSGKFAVFHLRGEVVRSLEAVNAAAEFMAGRQLIGAQRPIDPVRLADPSVSMKEVAA